MTGPGSPWQNTTAISRSTCSLELGLQEHGIGNQLDPFHAGVALVGRDAIDRHPLCGDLQVVPGAERCAHVRNCHRPLGLV